MRHTSPPGPKQMPLFPPPESGVELTTQQEDELIRTLAELLLEAAGDAQDPKRGGRSESR